MLGPQSVLTAVKNRLDDALPAVVERLRGTYDLDFRDLPELGGVLDYTPNVQTLGDFPTVFCSWVGADQESLAQTATTAAGLGEEYTYVYRVQVYALIMADDYRTTETQQRVLEQAIREAMLSKKDLTPEHAMSGEQIRVNATMVRSEPSDIFPDGSSRYMGAVMVEVPLTVDEQLHLPHLRGPEASFEPVHPSLR